MNTLRLTDGQLRSALLAFINDRLEPGLELTPDLPLDALDIDSLDLIELAQAVDDEFGIMVGAEAVRHAETLGDLLDAMVSSR
jgi:acyl carrier protein